MSVFRTMSPNADPSCVSQSPMWAVLRRLCLSLIGLAVWANDCGNVMAQATTGQPGLQTRGSGGVEEEMMEGDEDMGDGDMGDRGYGQGYGEEDMGDEMGDDMGDEGSGYGDGGGDGSGGGYGSGGGRGNGPRATVSSPQADAMAVYGATFASLRDQLSFSSLFAPTRVADVESGPFLGRDAEDAFKAGNHPLALALMFGHMTVEQRDALVALQTVKYNALLRRPVWNIRWGVSLAIRGDISGDPQPIMEGATPPGGGSRGGGASGRGGRGGAPGGGVFGSGGSGGGGFPRWRGARWSPTG